MRSLLNRAGVFSALLSAACSVQAIAQVSIPGNAPKPLPLAGPVITASGDSAERIRDAQLAGTASTDGYLFRSTSSLTGSPASSRSNGFQILLPRITSTMNSDLPFGQNDGALWAGKGYNYRVLAGAMAKFGPLKLILVPEFVSESNYRMSINPIDLRFSRPIPSSRSQFSSPFNVVPYSIDWPYRMGDSSVAKLHPGQSSATLGLGPIEVGASTENEWWGPAARNPILLGDNAPGFPHAFLRTGRPLRSPIGVFEGRWIVGGLKESDYFDTDPDNNIRSLSSFGFSWKRSPTSNMTFGFARSVYAPSDGYGNAFSRAFDFLKSTGHPNALPAADSTMIPGPDQIIELFGRWVIPGYGLETYLEWARAELPRSFRDLLVEPNHTRGYTAGLQWLHAFTNPSHRVRVQTELTNVEQSSSYRFRPIGSFYSSRAVIQGYTNEGQMLGSASGPGSSTQWIGIDYMRPSFMAGANFGRTRVNNDAFFLRSNPHRCFHDVTLSPGLRGGFTTKYFNVRADWNKIKRLNAFFQRTRGCGTNETAIGDRDSQHFSLTFTTLGW
jgi:hypothetical protein